MSGWRHVLHPTRALATVLLAAGTLLGSSCSALVSDAELQGRLTVNVVTRQGAPISDVSVLLFRGDRHFARTLTDSLGRAIFRGVPRAPGYGVIATLADPVRGLGSLGTGLAEGNIIAPIAIEGGDEIEVEMTLLKVGTGIFEAQVLDQFNLPIVDIEVFAYTPVRFIGSQRSDAEGRVRFTEVPYGIFGAYALVPDSVGGPGSGTVTVEGFFFDAGHLVRHTYVVTRCLGSITTRVLDQFDTLVVDYPVNLYNSQRFLRLTRTNAAGEVVFSGVSCGGYGVSAAPNMGFSINNVRGEGFVDDIFLTAGQAITRTVRVIRNP